MGNPVTFSFNYGKPMGSPVTLSFNYGKPMGNPVKYPVTSEQPCEIVRDVETCGLTL